MVSVIVYAYNLRIVFILGESYGVTSQEGAFTPTMQTPESFRAKASEGEVVVIYFEPLATQDLKFSGVPDLSGVAESEA